MLSCCSHCGHQHLIPPQAFLTLQACFQSTPPPWAVTLLLVLPLFPFAGWNTNLNTALAEHSFTGCRRQVAFLQHWQYAALCQISHQPCQSIDDDSMESVTVKVSGGVFFLLPRPAVFVVLLRTAQCISTEDCYRQQWFGNHCSPFSHVRQLFTCVLSPSHPQTLDTAHQTSPSVLLSTASSVLQAKDIFLQTHYLICG